MSAHSVGTNCTEDDDDASFANLKSLLTRNVSVSSDSSADPDEQLTITPDQTRRRWDVPPTVYVAGYVAKKLLQLTNARNCETCTRLLQSTETLPEHSLIAVKELTVNGLTRPRTRFMYYVKQTMEITFTLLPQIGHHKNIKDKIIKYLVGNIDLKGLTCGIHNIRETFVAFTVKFSIFVWCKRLNRCLTGQDSRPHAVLDPVQRLAVERYRKSLKSKVRK